MRQRFFITSTGTGIGKSFIAAAMVRQAKAIGRTAMAYKPIISGFDTAHIAESDTALLLRSLDLPLSEENIDKISPWRFKAALAPSMAARCEDRTIDFDKLVDHGRSAFAGKEDLVISEGVGGVMVPLDDEHTVLDWINALSAQTILVTGSYLGTISHTLTALAVLQQKKISVRCVIVNESEKSSVPLSSAVRELSRWSTHPIITVRRRAFGDWAEIQEMQAILT
jgi:dethiobiotin synthetase